MRRFLTWACLLPIAIILIAFSVANRNWIEVVLDPFNPSNPVLSFKIPLFVLLFITLIIGMLLGGFITWLRQGKHRKLAREKRFEADKWRQEADIQKQRAEASYNQTAPSKASLSNNATLPY